MKKVLYLALGLLIALSGSALYINLRPSGSEPGTPVAGTPSDLTQPSTRGEYLARAADCLACHTVPGSKEYAGGLPFKMPFGTIYATNITADKETGIGNWDDDQFVRAVRQGISPHGNLYPAMPYTSYTAMSRDDVLAIKGYLFTLNPVHQANLVNALGFPFNQRWAMKFWNLAFFKDQRLVPDINQSESWNRGAYLATALGHCGECHTARNLGFAMAQGEYLGGALIQGWSATNITSDKISGIGAWSDQQLGDYLSKGHAVGRSSASGPMAEVVEHSLQYLTKEDMHALVGYLRSVAPLSNNVEGFINLQPRQVVASTALLPGGSALSSESRGPELFEGDCAGCHLWNGAGRQSPYASLLGSRAVNDPNARSVIQAILKGTLLKVADREEFMPDFGEKYSNEDIASLANYIVAHFGGKTGHVTADQVARQREE